MRRLLVTLLLTGANTASAVLMLTLQDVPYSNVAAALNAAGVVMGVLIYIDLLISEAQK